MTPRKKPATSAKRKGRSEVETIAMAIYAGSCLGRDDLPPFSRQPKLRQGTWLAAAEVFLRALRGKP